MQDAEQKKDDAETVRPSGQCCLCPGPMAMHMSFFSRIASVSSFVLCWMFVLVQFIFLVFFPALGWNDDASSRGWPVFFHKWMIQWLCKS